MVRLVERRSTRPDQYVVELSDRLCGCGCGERTMVAPRTINSRGVTKGDPRRFVAGHQGRVSSLRPRKFRLVIVKVRGRRPRPLCCCGCGERVARRGTYRPGHAPFRPLKAVRFVVEDRGFSTPCWVWALGVDKHGYGKTTRRGVRLKAHRVAYEEAFGSVPEGHDVHHECEEKLCVNPAHLRALTPEAHGQLHGEGWRRAA